MNSEIYWVFGCSGSGKARFINFVSGKPPLKLLKKLNWNGRKIVKIQDSLDLLEHYVGDTINKKRNQIIKKVVKEAKNPEKVILLKGQLIDFDHDLPQRLQKKLPDLKHHIIYLYSGLETSFKRCYNKTWWNKKWDVKENIGGFKKYAKKEVEIISSLKGFDVFSLNSKNDNYDEVAFPPEF